MTNTAYKEGFVRDLIDNFVDFDSIILVPVLSESEDLRLDIAQKETLEFFYGELVEYWFQKVITGDKMFY